MKTWVGVVGALVLTSGCAHFECKLHGGDEVRSLKTDHFVVTSDLPPEEHRAQAERLELLWDTFAAFFHADVATAQVPVVVLKSTEIVEWFASDYAGFVRRNGPNVLVVGAVAADPRGRDTNAHELTHLVSAFMLPRQPRWLAEGLASLFEDATFKDARTVKMGRWNTSRAEEAFQVGVLSLDELSRWGGLTFDSSETLYYASAWAWVHYLANHEEPRLLRLFDGLRSSRPLAELMNELFPPAEAQRLHAAVKAYLGEARFRGWETSLRRTPKIEAAVVLAPWEVHALRSRLHLRNDEAARKDLEVAVSVAPVPLPPRAAVLKAELEKRDPKELLATYPASGPVLVAAHRHFDPDLDAANLQKALEGPDVDADLLLLAANFAFFGKTVDLGLASTYADRGGELAPWSVEFATLRAQVALQQKDCKEAEARATQAASLLSERAQPADLEEMKKLRDRVATCGAK
jgi:hypothetical protein